MGSRQRSAMNTCNNTQSFVLATIVMNNPNCYKEHFGRAMAASREKE